MHMHARISMAICRLLIAQCHLNKKIKLLDCKGTFLRIFRAKIRNQGLETKYLVDPEKSGGLVTMSLSWLVRIGLQWWKFPNTE